jgi:hypothetical protein
MHSENKVSVWRMQLSLDKKAGFSEEYNFGE